jgi:hypothetical protein
MQVRQRVGDVAHTGGGVALGERAEFDDFVKQLAATHQLHHKVRRVSSVNHSVNLHNVRMSESRHDCRLA